MNKNKKDYLLTTLMFQFLVCAITFGILFGLKFTGFGLTDSLKEAYFDNLERNYILELKETDSEVVNNTTDETPAKEVYVTNKPKTTSNEVDNDSDDTTKVKLTAKIKAEGGADYSVSDVKDIPDNVSVNNYTLNQKIFMPAKGEITSPFGVRNHPISGELRFHAGIDIASDIGTSIYSAFDGVVVVADYDEWNGYYLKIQHDNEILTVYCHCNKLLVKEGDIVKMGEKIAEMGSTGSSTGPHLHFELRIKNVSYDPEIVLCEAINGI